MGVYVWGRYISMRAPQETKGVQLGKTLGYGFCYGLKPGSLRTANLLVSFWVKLQQVWAKL